MSFFLQPKAKKLFNFDFETGNPDLTKEMIQEMMMDEIYQFRPELKEYVGFVCFFQSIFSLCLVNLRSHISIFRRFEPIKAERAAKRASAGSKQEATSSSEKSAEKK